MNDTVKNKEWKVDSYARDIIQKALETQENVYDRQIRATAHEDIRKIYEKLKTDVQNLKLALR